LAKKGHDKCAEREPVTGVWGGAPSRVQGQSPWWEVRGALKLKQFWLLDKFSTPLCVAGPLRRLLW